MPKLHYSANSPSLEEVNHYTVTRGQSYLILQEYKEGKTMIEPTANMWGLVSEGTEYLVEVKGKAVARIQLDPETAIRYLPYVDQKKRKPTAQGLKFESIFFQNLDAIYDRAKKEIEKSCKSDSSYARKNLQNNAWVGLLLGIVARKEICQDPLSGDGIHNGENLPLEPEVWLKCLRQVVEEVNDISSVVFANNLKRALLSEEINQELTMVADLSDDDIAEVAELLTGELTEEEEGNLKNVTEDSEVIAEIEEDKPLDIESLTKDQILELLNAQNITEFTNEHHTTVKVTNKLSKPVLQSILKDSLSA